MFDLSRYEELMLRHRHSDGSWSELEATPAPNHGPAAHDPERAWDDSRLFVCRACGEEVEVAVRDPDRRVS
jgi:hypothetical protein